MTTFSYTTGNPSNLTAGATASMTDISGPFTDLRTFLNGTNLDSTNLADVPETLLAIALQQKLGLSDGAQIGRGKSIIAGAEPTVSATYAFLGTPDRVSSVVLPTDGLIAVAYQALWTETVSTAARAAIFIGANQLKGATNAGAPAVCETSMGGTANVATPLYSVPVGLASTATGSAASEVTTGQVVGSQGAGLGGPCYIFAAAGTYDVSVKFKCSSGSVAAQNRHLWVWTIGF